MKKTLITLCLSLCCVVAFAQSFEGTIVYKNTFKSKMPAVSDQQFADMMGPTQTWSISGAAYRSDMNGQLVQWQLYVPADNKLYTKMANSADALWNDVAENKDEVLSAEVHPSNVEILGYKCEELVLTCKSGVQKYYFNKKLAIDAKLFTNHKFGNWYAMLAEAGAVPLKTVVDNPQFTIESIATEIKPAKLDKALFVLPAGVGTAKNPY
jgi:hypothetical protein